MCCLFHFIAVLGLLLSLSGGQAEKRHLYVIPTPTSSGCPKDEVCRTLSDYLQNVSDYFTSNTTIHFLSGNHTVSEPANGRVTVQDVQNFALSADSADTTLHCVERLGFEFKNAIELSITNLTIANCGCEIVDLLMHLDTKAAVALFNIRSLVLQNVRIEASHGYGLLGVNVLGDSIVNNCTFTNNMWRSDGADNSSVPNRPGGNALFVFRLYHFKSVLGNLHISQCIFSHGRDTTNYFQPRVLFYEQISRGSGLGIFLFTQLNFDSYTNSEHSVNITITDSIFHHNKAPHGSGGNLFIIFHVKHNRFSSVIHVNNCTLYAGNAAQGGGIFVGSTRNEASAARSIVRVSNSTITNNLARSGGGVCIYAAQRDASNEWFFRIENSVFMNNKAMQGAAVHIAGYIQWEYGTSCIIMPPPQEYDHAFGPVIYISISETVFLQNAAKRDGGGININYFLHTVRLREDFTAGTVRVVCTRCNFTDNKADSGYAVGVSGCWNDEVSATNPPDYQMYKVSIQLFDTRITFNSRCKHDKRDYCVAAFCVCNTEEVRLSNSTFVGNKGSAVYVRKSKIIIIGVVNIINNYGINGGGFYLDCNPQSFVYLTPHSQLYMTNNRASSHGGAIAVQDCNPAPDSSIECFIQMFDEHRECSSWTDKMLTVTEAVECYDTKIIMENNTADVAGDSIYGGSLQSCHILLEIELENEKIEFITLQTSIMDIRNKLSPSEVTSNPFQVRFCDSKFKMINGSECISETEAVVYRGQTLQIPAIGVGQFNNASPSVIRTRITSNTSEILLGERQSVQELGRDCGSLEYLFKFSQKAISKIELQIFVESSKKNHLAIAHVTVANCPPGFELSNEYSTCECQLHLKIPGVKCDIDTQKFYRPAPMWIGHYREEQLTVHTNCPFHYCKSEDTEFTLDNQDDQCAFNHSGVLCGSCQQGLSLALGTSQCLKCSNVYLLLLIPFALAGVALVFLLLKCNLTVSVGSINGLIFYANIIQVNHTTFFPHGAQDMSPLTKGLSIFIAWLNLDLGIQTCFFTGMSAYTKAWLQFVFPAYVWIMVGFMIYGSRHYPTVSRLTGSNAVQVLATLFLLSYAKLLRTVIAASFSTTLTGRDSSTPLVWLLDGNVQFFKGMHVGLLVMALVVVFIYIAPFTILVLLSPCLQASSNPRIHRLISIKLKPLLDAYQGPYKDKFRYWTGLMLLVRVILFAMFIGNILGKPDINLFTVNTVIVLLLIFCWNAGRVYKNLLWNMAESFYLLNLVILTAATSLLRGLGETSTMQEIVTDVMVGTALAVFCVTVLYHFFTYLLKISVHSIKQTVQTLLRKKSCNREELAAASGIIDTVGASNNVHTVSYVELSQLRELREPLLSDT